LSCRSAGSLGDARRAVAAIAVSDDI
jgi:hypothetical protein